ncbi:MAG: FKBP-type peptidyl-prolyl cis-trans isomerase [Bacteroidota bacterium]|nr:MAG: FKBP-type peptidyl-prolyl cis-trans isomerase [Bacteroidota bacterium]
MKNKLFLILAIIMLTACSQSPFEGYKKSPKGFYYQLKGLGESQDEVVVGDFITIDISYSTISDSVFFSGRRKLRIEEPAYKGAIEDCFMSLHPGESASFILLAEPFFKQTLETDLPGFFAPEAFMKVLVTIIEVQKISDYENEKQAFLNWTEDFGEYERVILQQYMAEEKLNTQPTASGLVYVPIVQGAGKKIEIGDTITIDYEGIFLNGKYFDSTKRRRQPFQFVYGTEWQVIKGLEEGLSFMREGDRAMFIVPSELAFGATGSSTGIVPPFTSLIFEVEVRSVKEGAKEKI